MTTNGLNGYCLTVTVRPEGCEIPVFMENTLDPESLLSVIDQGLTAEYRVRRDVIEWCFHTVDQTPIPGLYRRCRCENLEQWLFEQAARTFGWSEADVQRAMSAATTPG